MRRIKIFPFLLSGPLLSLLPRRSLCSQRSFPSQGMCHGFPVGSGVPGRSRGKPAKVKKSLEVLWDEEKGAGNTAVWEI